MSRHVIMVDCETNGRYVHAGHESWEWAYWNLTTGARGQFFVYLGDISEFLRRSDPIALRVGRFLDRYPLDGGCPSRHDTEQAMIRMISDICPDGTEKLPVLLGSNPAFDAGFWRALANRFSFPPEPFHHHPKDLGSFAAGVLGITVGSQSLGAEAVARLCSLTPGGHSAEGDVTAQGRAFLLLDYVARHVATHGGRPLPVLHELRRRFSPEEIDEVFVGLDAAGLLSDRLGAIGAGAGDPDPFAPSGAVVTS